MKRNFTKLFFALSLLLSVSLMSCSEEEPSASAAGLAGPWNMSGLNYTGTTTTAGITVSYVGVGSNYTYILDFDDSNNTYMSTGGYDVALTSTVVGQTFTQNVSIPSVIASGTWSLNAAGTEITMNDSGGTSSTIPIFSISANELVLDYAGLSAFSSGGGVALVDISGSFSFVR